MGKRITDVASPEFDRLFTGFQHTAYRLETLQRYDMGYEEGPFAAFLAGQPYASDPAKDEWTGIIMDATETGKVMQRVHVVEEPLTDYLRYEIEVSYRPNHAAGEDIRILPVITWPALPRRDYWLFDSRDLWVMEYADDGRFLYAEQADDPAEIVKHNYWRDAALHAAIPYADYLNRMDLLRYAS